jgi:hypothetical protein
MIPRPALASLLLGLCAAGAGLAPLFETLLFTVRAPGAIDPRVTQANIGRHHMRLLLQRHRSASGQRHGGSEAQDQCLPGPWRPAPQPH